VNESVVSLRAAGLSVDLSNAQWRVETTGAVVTGSDVGAAVSSCQLPAKQPQLKFTWTPLLQVVQRSWRRLLRWAADLMTLRWRQRDVTVDVRPAAAAVDWFCLLVNVLLHLHHLSNVTLVAIAYTDVIGIWSVFVESFEAGDRHWVGQTVTAFHWTRHWSVAWVRRPAARRTHWTFEAKTAGYDSYFRQ